MTALVISNIIPPLLVIGYVLCRKLHKETWGGWSFESLEEWWLYIKLAVPGLLMVVLEWSAFEVLNFIAGSLSETALSVNIMWFQLLIILFMVSTADLEIARAEKQRVRIHSVIRTPVSIPPSG